MDVLYYCLIEFKRTGFMANLVYRGASRSGKPVNLVKVGLSWSELVKVVVLVSSRFVGRSLDEG